MSTFNTPTKPSTSKRQKNQIHPSIAPETTEIVNASLRENLRFLNVILQQVSVDPGAKPTIFNIFTTEPGRVYKPGEYIQGYISLTTRTELSLERIVLVWMGLVLIQYTRQSGGQKYHYSNIDALFFKRLSVFGYGLDDIKFHSKLFHLEIGHLQFPFKLKIPDSTPGNFESPQYGKIEYRIDAHIELPGTALDIEAEPLLINVLPILDIQKSVPQMLTPSVTSGSESFCCWCCKSGLITYNIHMEKTAFVLGDIPISFYVEVENGTLMNISLKALLMTEVLYEGQREGKSTTNIIAEKETLVTLVGPRIGHGKNATWNVSMPLPSRLCQPSWFGKRLKHIVLEYFIKLVIQVPLFINIERRVPIVIGTD